MNDYKEYLETGMLGSYRPESAIVKKSDSGAAFAVFRDSTYTLDDDTCTREREMLIKGKRFIISSVFPVKAKRQPRIKCWCSLTQTSKKMQKVSEFFRF